MAQVRVTMTRTLYNRGGSLMNSGSTYLVEEAFAAELVGMGAATDPDSHFTPPNSHANFKPADGASSISVTSTSAFYHMGSASRLRMTMSGNVRIRFGSWDVEASRTADILVISGDVYDKPSGALGFAIVTDSGQGGTVTVSAALGS